MTVSTSWKELPTGVRQFDYDTITDVILHMRYTAREGGGLLRKEAIAEAIARGYAEGIKAYFAKYPVN